MIESSLHSSEPVMLPERPLGRLRSIVGYGVLNALMIVLSIPVFVPAALVLCALRNGRRAAWISLGIAAVLAVLLFSATPAPADQRNFVLASFAGVVLAIAVPTLAALPLIERGESYGSLLVFLLAGSTIGLAATELGARAVAGYSPYAAHVAQAKAMTAELVSTYRTMGMPTDAVQLAERWGSYYATTLQPAAMLLTGAMVFVLSMLMLGRLRGWRAFAATHGTGATDTFQFRNFALPEWLPFAFVLGGLAPLATGMLHKIAANTLMIVVCLFMLQGFALLRFLLASIGIGFVGALLTMGLAMISGIGPLLLAVAGLFDPFFDFRHFKKRKDDSHESHSD